MLDVLDVAGFDISTNVRIVYLMNLSAQVVANLTRSLRQQHMIS